MGHSMGGIISMTTALAYPKQVAGLVLIGTASQCNEKTAGWYERIALAGEKDGNAGLARAIYGEKSKKVVIQGDAKGNRRGDAHAQEPLRRSPDPEARRDRPAPCCCSSATRTRWARRLPRSSPHSFPTRSSSRSPIAATGFTSSEPDTVIDAIDRFLPRLEP